jgi:ParB-like chromosome segregation protein Spo0J
VRGSRESGLPGSTGQARRDSLRAKAWPRRYIDEERVEDFAALYREQGHTALPPLELVNDGHGRLLIADGVHRWQAARKAGLTEVLATVHVL